MREIRIGHCLDVLRQMEPESVQCIVSSPPYFRQRRYCGQQEAVWGGDTDCAHEWASRRYYNERAPSRRAGDTFSAPGAANIARLKEARWQEDVLCSKCGAWHGALGLEPTPDLYVEHLVAILGELRRVLRGDGTLWLNLGDKYNGSGGAGGDYGVGGRREGQARYPGTRAAGLKPKDLFLVPFRVALAAQAAGWWLRSVIVWERSNCLPESVTDRPTESHEYILLLTKSARYFFDADAVRESSRPDAKLAGAMGSDGSRNLRTVWTFPTRAYPGSHSAVFPPELPRRSILAGTPPKVCATCAAPWRRQTRREVDNTGYPGGPGGNYASKGRPAGGQEQADSSTLHTTARYRVTTLGWQPTCGCHGEPSTESVACESCQGTGIEHAYPGDGPNTAGQNKEPYAGNNPHLLRLEKQPTGEPCPVCEGAGEATTEAWRPEVLEAWPTRPAIVLDPFVGSGTTAMVAESLGRWWIGIDISDEYRPQIERRTAQRSMSGGFANELF